MPLKTHRVEELKHIKSEDIQSSTIDVVRKLEERGASSSLFKITASNYTLGRENPKRRWGWEKFRPPYVRASKALFIHSLVRISP
ncbi:hypothetical protein TNCV_3012361 [Trichonephila clavipes]|nr:hypothetical protein TNCV_3012361 [Trichonephila clavipes]